jgi:hypothetical protein
VFVGYYMGFPHEGQFVLGVNGLVVSSWKECSNTLGFAGICAPRVPTQGVLTGEDVASARGVLRSTSRASVFTLPQKCSQV